MEIMEIKMNEQNRISLHDLLEMLEEAQRNYNVAKRYATQTEVQRNEKGSKIGGVIALVQNLKQTCCHYAPMPDKENFLSLRYFERDLSEWIRCLKCEIAKE